MTKKSTIKKTVKKKRIQKHIYSSNYENIIDIIGNEKESNNFVSKSIFIFFIENIKNKKSRGPNIIA